MTSETRVLPSEITGAYGAFVKFAARRMVGKVPDSLGVLWHHQSVMKDSMGIGRKVEGWRELDPARVGKIAGVPARGLRGQNTGDLRAFPMTPHADDAVPSISRAGPPSMKGAGMILAQRNARRSFVSMTIGALMAAFLLTPTSAEAGPACISVGSQCYSSVQAAVDAAPDGGTVVLPAGRFAGGVIIAKSLTLRGAGAGRSVIAGGEHVVTVGEFLSDVVPTVTIAKVTITGGFARSLPYVPGGVFAGGGGLLIVPTATVDDYTGPKVTIVDSVISGNRVEPTTQVGPAPEQEEFWPRCPDGFCPFAGAEGAGIDNLGTLTLLRTTVAHNTSGGGLTSDAVGGGINSNHVLTLIDSLLVGNAAKAVAPYGRYAEGGGVFADHGTTELTIRRSSVVGNSASIQAVFPAALPDGTVIDTLANSGGVHAGNDAEVVIVGSHIDRNVASYHNPNGSWGVINAGLQVGVSHLTLRDSSVSGNRATARLMSTSAPNGGPTGGAFEWDGDATISGSRFENNVSETIAGNGDAAVGAAVASLSILATGASDNSSTMTNSRVSHNLAIARTRTGAALVEGSGLLNQSALTVRGVRISGNAALGYGKSVTLHGGGIANGPLLFNDPSFPPGNLVVVDSAITGNRLVGATNADRQGSGIFSIEPMTLTRSVVKGNKPEPQCVGCTASFQAVRSAQAGVGATVSERGGPRTAPMGPWRLLMGHR